HGSVAIRRGMGIRDLLRALRRKELIGVVGDQDAGKREGVIVSFFGRKTTVPTGAFELAKRTGAPILPCFIVRRPGGRHEIFVEEPIRLEPEGEYDFEPYVRQFIEKLERLIETFPSQWLWATKRWKHTWTKRLLILSDGKAGHVKQSQALAFQMRSVTTQYDRPGMEYPTQTVEVRFKSEWHKMIFRYVALFFIPWAQGRLAWLRLFFTPETCQAVCEASADFVISSGSALTPLNLCLARECRAKSIVLMKPSFPFNLFRYDLAVIPAHDEGLMPGEAFRTLLTPSLVDREEIEESAHKIRISLPHPERVKLALFLGGPTRRYRMELEEVERLTEILEKMSGSSGDYLVTTSRRSPEEITRFLKKSKTRLKACQMLVIASEDKRPEVVPGMMALADILIVTEDSISMISEAVSSGKKVIVLSLGTRGLPEKHQRFREILARESAVVVAELEDLEEKISRIDHYVRPQGVFQRQNEALRRRLQEIL
ncbi:MAG TPA: ELM1/GtrOC1 family putative glycosyltransferase, partial [bacterium]|nr:ELM1/GtrOC1 family putative glycosyltransferase [bacterium]